MLGGGASTAHGVTNLVWSDEFNSNISSNVDGKSKSPPHSATAETKSVIHETHANSFVFMALLTDKSKLENLDIETRLHQPLRFSR
jgi:hypothetical protein